MATRNKTPDQITAQYNRLKATLNDRNAMTADFYPYNQYRSDRWWNTFQRERERNPVKSSKAIWRQRQRVEDAVDNRISELNKRLDRAYGSTLFQAYINESNQQPTAPQPSSAQVRGAARAAGGKG